jgi:hypothetical protein
MYNIISDLEFKLAKEFRHCPGMQFDYKNEYCKNTSKINDSAK